MIDSGLYQKPIEREIKDLEKTIYYMQNRKPID
jgi:hypothetical protein